MICQVEAIGSIDLPWLKSKVAELGDGALLFIQGYEWIGFTVWKNGFEFPPDVSFTWQFSEIWDLRLFSESGEWHAWKTGDGIWMARLAKPGDFTSHQKRDYVLWGRIPQQQPNSVWTSVSEANGACIQVPFAVVGDLTDSPVRLTAWLKVCLDPETGQAYFGDMMLRNLYQ